jgi:hypothetical protein
VKNADSAGIAAEDDNIATSILSMGVCASLPISAGSESASVGKLQCSCISAKIPSAGIGSTNAGSSSGGGGTTGTGFGGVTGPGPDSQGCVCVCHDEGGGGGGGLNVFGGGSDSGKPALEIAFSVLRFERSTKIAMHGTTARAVKRSQPPMLSP